MGKEIRRWVKRCLRWTGLRDMRQCGGGAGVGGMWAAPSPGVPSKLKKIHQVETKLGKGYRPPGNTQRAL